MEKKYITQCKKVSLSFSEFPKSRFMVSVDTNIPIQNVCRYVEMLRDSNKIYFVKKGYCKISKQKVEFLSTDPNFKEDDNQLTFFD